MAKEFKLPELGENIESVDVSSVLVSAGDAIRKDQPVIEVETEKASLEVPAPFSGIVEKVHVRPGDKIAVGQILLTIYEEGEDAEARPRPGEVEVAAVDTLERPLQAQAAVETVQTAVGEESYEERPANVVQFSKPEIGEPAPAAPSVRKLARELGIDIGRIHGSGPSGRISMGDVKQYAKRQLSGPVRPGAGAAAPAAPTPLPDFGRWGEVERKPLSTVRRKTAENMSNAWSAIPHVTQFDRADVTELESLRKRFGQRVEAAGGKLTVTAIVLKVVGSALRVFPKFNASLDIDREEIIFKKYVHIGVAVDTDRGLLVPVIRNVDRKNIVEIAAELTELAGKARDRKISLDELQGSSFTVTNLGGLGTTYFSPIVNWPEVAILGVGRAEMQAIHRDGQFVPRLILPLSVSYDHRWIDGADAARFLRWIAEALEQPMLVALEG